MWKKNWSTLWSDTRHVTETPTRGWHAVMAALAVVALSVLLLHGCGYRFAVDGPGPRIGGNAALTDDEGPVVRLVIRTFRNRTFHRHLGDVHTRAMRQELAVGSGARVVADDARADYVMTGEIVSAAVSSITFSTDETRERRVEVTASATVTHRRTGGVVWTGAATGAGEFFVNRLPAADNRQDEIQFNRVLRDRAMEQASQEAAAALVASFREARRQGVFDPATPSPSSPPPAASPPTPPPSTFTPPFERLPGTLIR